MPGSFDLSADGEWLAFTAAPDSAGTRNVMALRMSTLTPLSDGGLVTADIAGSSSTLWGGVSSPIALATGGGLDVTLALDPAAGIAKALPNSGASYRNWTRRHSPKEVTVEGDGLASVAAVDLSPDGATVISAVASGGTLTRWTLSGTVNALTLAQSDTTYETGLDTISSVAIYAVGKPNATKTIYAVGWSARRTVARRRRVRFVSSTLQRARRQRSLRMPPISAAASRPYA